MVLFEQWRQQRIYHFYQEYPYVGYVCNRFYISAGELFSIIKRNGGAMPAAIPAIEKHKDEIIEDFVTNELKIDVIAKKYNVQREAVVSLLVSEKVELDRKDLLTSEEKAIVDAWTDAGGKITQLELQKRFNVGAWKVSKALRKAGLTKVSTNKFSDEEKEDIITSYKDGTGAYVIASKYDSDHRNIYAVLEEAGIPMRTRSEATSLNLVKRHEHGYTPIFEDFRKFQRLATRVKDRDNEICQLCGIDYKEHPEIELQVHHVREKDWFPELEYEIRNLITLCRDCHLGKVTSREDAYIDQFDEIMASKYTGEDYEAYALWADTKREEKNEM